MLVSNYVVEKIKKFSHMDKVKELSVGHNKVAKVNVEISSILIQFNKEDELIEIEVKSDEKNLGWIYRDDIEFLIYEKERTMWMTNFRSVRILVEACAKKYGKQYCTEPTAYHIRKTDKNEAFYYLKEEDIIALHNVGL